MRAVLQRLSAATRPRNLLVLALTLGLVAASVGEDTSALGYAEYPTNPSIFESGTVDIAGLVSGSSASTLPSVTAFKWDTGGAGTNCANVLTGTNINAQGMTPGQFCVAPITLRNTNPKSLAAWFRVRLVRRTPAGGAGSVIEEMNARLRFYMSEYAGGSARTAAQYQAADCNINGFRPVSPVSGTAKSTAAVADVSDASGGSRTALVTVGPGGKNVGKHPGVSLPADSAVTALVGTGFGLSAGTGLASPPTETATLDSSNMSTDPSNPATYNAFNLLGNDEVTNTAHMLNSSSPNGTRPGGSLSDAALAAGATRYYCAALYFPSDSDLTAGNAAGDNAAAGASLIYHVVVTAAQQFKRSVD